MGITGNWSRLNIIIFFEDIESYKINNTKLKIKFKKRTGTSEEEIESYQKLQYLRKTHEDLNLPNGTLSRYPFLNSYPIENLSKKQIFEIENLLNEKQILSEK
jgi:hypothetical protein